MGQIRDKTDIQSLEQPKREAIRYSDSGPTDEDEAWMDGSAWNILWRSRPPQAGQGTGKAGVPVCDTPPERRSGLYTKQAQPLPTAPVESC